MESLLLEIGTEEIPAGYIVPALKALSSLISKKLTASRIDFGAIGTFGTPKRLAVIVSEVAPRQGEKTTEITGPPEKVAFDDAGKPRVPAIKFAEKAGVAIEDIVIKETGKGRYLTAVVEEKTQATAGLLEKILPEAILEIPFPKTMRWADLKISFARPIISVTALLGENLVPFTLGNIDSDTFVFGHRFINPGKVNPGSAENYVKTLEEAGVFVDIQARRQLVVKEVEAAAKSVGGAILEDEDLVDIVSNLVEYPAAVAGRFDDEFLELPDEVLITAMREHQKYFAVADESGKLMPHFIAVNNAVAKDVALVTSGHEKVIRARLADAKFFYKVDIAETLEKMVGRLDKVLFQAKLGSVADKIGRIGNLCSYMCDGAGDHGEKIRDDVKRAAFLCKADLVSQVVIEFTKLQGVIGRVYAEIAGETENTCRAIEEHYMPTHSGAQLPGTLAGSLLAIADKIDSICGCFSVDLIPTGASDPYALRRQGIGIIQIINNMGLPFSLEALVEQGVKNYPGKSDQEISVITSKIYDFLKNRTEHILAEEGFSRDVVSAVSESGIQSLPDVWQRTKALENLKTTADFEPLAATFKRVVNIIRKADDLSGQTVDPALFQDESESLLYNAYMETSALVKSQVESGNYENAFASIASLRSHVDRFFDDVMVMDKNENIRQNRLALLGVISDIFIDIADFTRISV